MSMRIQDALSNCCEAIREFAASAAVCIARTGSTICTTVAETMSKVAEFARPYFESLRTLAQEHHVPILIATIAFGVGAAVSAFITTVFCNNRPASTSGATTV
jgi:ABC-type transporter Mla subunit MlaD